MIEAGASNEVFISHNAADRPYAEALERVIHELVGNRGHIDVRYSTSEDAGPEGGEPWRVWIDRRVVGARTTLIVVTPHALGKPWLLWEAGAVNGAALARKAMQGVNRKRGRGAAPKVPDNNPIIVSLAYGLPDSECPDPLRGEQIIQGTNVERLKHLLNRILQAHGVTGNVFEARKKKALKRYLAAVQTAMMRSPSLVNEANVQDWLARLDALAGSDRRSELGGFERWMMLAFGRDTDEDARSGGIPIDVRLHRQIGELYLGQRQYRQAVRQLRLAWRAAPRDIFVLRPLAEASMKNLMADRADAVDASMREEIKTLLDAISELDERAYTANPEAAALRAKFHRRVLGEPEKAIDVYKQALESNPNSYYLADGVAQTELELGHHDEARINFRRALEIIEHLGESNIWSHATAATACVGLADVDGARQRLTQLRAIEPPPSESEVDSIGRGIREVGERSGVAEHLVNELLLTLDPRGNSAR